MKQLTDAERLEIAVSLLSENDVDVYGVTYENDSINKQRSRGARI